jgi:hypothetical protein
MERIVKQCISAPVAALVARRLTLLAMVSVASIAASAAAPALAQSILGIDDGHVGQAWIAGRGNDFMPRQEPDRRRLLVETAIIDQCGRQRIASAAPAADDPRYQAACTSSAMELRDGGAGLGVGAAGNSPWPAAKPALARPAAGPDQPAAVVGKNHRTYSRTFTYADGPPDMREYRRRALVPAAPLP